MKSIRRDKQDICDRLGISMATVNNWIKTGVIPAPDSMNTYGKDQFDSLVAQVRTGTSRLKGRANRAHINQKYISYLGITDKDRKALLVSLIEAYEETGLSISEGVLALSIALLKSNGLLTEGWDTEPGPRIERVLKEWLDLYPHNRDTVKDLFSPFRIPGRDDDLIGAFYQSVQSIAQKSRLGSYYTPVELLTKIKIPNDRKVLDPCCGSGGILLRTVSKNHDSSKIHAFDIDPLGVKIVSVNFALFFGDPDYQCKIKENDITEKIEGTYEFIITNPPWGSKLSSSQKDRLILAYPDLATTETFSIALQNCLDALAKNGELYFFLPHSILNVAAHKNIRKKIIGHTGSVGITLLGNAFKGVLSQAILLKMDSSRKDGNILIESRNGGSFLIPKTELIAPNFIIPASSSTFDRKILDKIHGTEHSVLDKNTVFALGIVTGNNRQHLLSAPTEKSEPVYRGRDVRPYGFYSPACFIEYTPGIYQQAAPEKYYRQTKIVYRFIGDRIVCALDAGGSLILNSANLLISGDYPMESLVCLFNSPVYTFIYRKKFHSRKLLKSHLRELPLPCLTDEKHQKLKEYHDAILEGTAGQESANAFIAEIFSLTRKEMDHILESTAGTGRKAGLDF